MVGKHKQHEKKHIINDVETNTKLRFSHAIKTHNFP
jgi:hypothetical protein